MLQVAAVCAERPVIVKSLRSSPCAAEEILLSVITEKALETSERFPSPLVYLYSVWQTLNCVSNYIILLKLEKLYKYYDKVIHFCVDLATKVDVVRGQIKIKQNL